MPGDPANKTDRSTEDAGIGVANRRLASPGFRNVPEHCDQLLSECGSAELARSSAIRAIHRVAGICGSCEHRHQHVEVRCVFEGSSGWIGRRLSHDLADLRLHLIWVGLRLEPVEVQVQGRLIDAIKILQVRHRRRSQQNEPKQLRHVSDQR